MGRWVGDGVACRSGKGAEKHRAVDIDRWAMMGREPRGQGGRGPPVRGSGERRNGVL